MNQKHLTLLINSFSLCLPVLIIQLYLLNNQIVTQLLITVIVTLATFGSLFLYGLIKRRKQYLLSFPIFIITFILFVKIVQYQDKVSADRADQLIIIIEKFKSENKQYPATLEQLEGKYIENIPKIWLGFIPSDYNYYFDERNKSFSLTKKFGKHGGKTWQSSMGSWDYYGD